MSGASDIPSSFGFPIFLRIFLPGIAGSILISYAMMPLFVPEWGNWDLEIKLAFFIISGTIFGVIITSLEFYIYQFYEGYRFWPKQLSTANHDRITKEFRKDVDRFWELEKIEREQDSLTIDQENEKSKILYKLRENPYRSENEYPFGRYPVCSTRLGNVMAEYESYSDGQYGMHMLLFWHQLWFLSSEEVRNFLNLASAKADFLLYMSSIFLVFAPIFGISIVYQTCSKFSININTIIISIILFIATVFISLLISYFFYRVSIEAIKIYGRNVKAFFDIYRFDLAEKLGVEIKLVPDDAEIDRWQNFGYFLLDHEKRDGDQDILFPREKTAKPDIKKKVPDNKQEK